LSERLKSLCGQNPCQSHIRSLHLQGLSNLFIGVDILVTVNDIIHFFLVPKFCTKSPTYHLPPELQNYRVESDKGVTHKLAYHEEEDQASVMDSATFLLQQATGIYSFRR
jgi:hypothetical protein